MLSTSEARGLAQALSEKFPGLSESDVFGLISEFKDPAADYGYTLVDSQINTVMVNGSLYAVTYLDPFSLQALLEDSLDDINIPVLRAISLSDPDIQVEWFAREFIPVSISVENGYHRWELPDGNHLIFYRSEVL